MTTKEFAPAIEKKYQGGGSGGRDVTSVQERPNPETENCTTSKMSFLTIKPESVKYAFGNNNFFLDIKCEMHDINKQRTFTQLLCYVTC